MTATVERIESWIVDVPTIRPHKLSMTTMGCQTLVIVRLTRSDGICGIGEATTIGGLSYGVESPEAISSAITHYLTPLLKGLPADNLNALTARMNSAIKGNTFAKSAIETALLDAQGKALGLPVSALLGGALQTSLPVLWTLASGDTAKDIAEGEKLLAGRRHQAFKLKIGARELATDLRHTRAIVEALGDRASIRVDVNQAWDAATGAKGCRELAAMGVDLIEQPVSAHDNAALVRLSQHIETAILADEAVATAYDGYQLAQPKPGDRTACWRWPASPRRRGLACMAARCWKGPSVPLRLCTPGRRCRCSGVPRCSARCSSKTILSACHSPLPMVR